MRNIFLFLSFNSFLLSLSNYKQGSLGKFPVGRCVLVVHELLIFDFSSLNSVTLSTELASVGLFSSIDLQYNLRGSCEVTSATQELTFSNVFQTGQSLGPGFRVLPRLSEMSQC